MKAKPKFWITRKFGNRIAHRKLNGFEERNPQIFELSHCAHGSWAEAHVRVMADRIADVARLRRELKNAERQLAKAQVMTPPAEKATS